MTHPIICAYNKDTGRQRPRNEDDVYAGQLTAREPGAPVYYLLAVADGVGGRQAGEWASRLAIQTLIQGLAAALRDGDPAAALRRSFERANAAVHDGSSADPGRRGAATTLVAALLAEDGRLWSANVGDSRAYLLQHDGLTQITDDHSWVAEQVRRGNLSAAEAAVSDHRHVITRSVGSKSAVEVDVSGPRPLTPGDVVLLCSDGLYGPVDEATIRQVAGAFEPSDAVERLIAVANERGGPDNISVAIGRFGAPTPAAPRSESAVTTPTSEPAVPTSSAPTSGLGAVLLFGVAIAVLLLILAAIARVP